MSIKKITLESLIYDLLGARGKLLSASKSIYSYDNPKNLVVFNANLVIDGKKVWYGDIDLTLQYQRLKTISSYVNKKVYILSEIDARFENEEKPKIENAIAEIDNKYIVLKPKEHFYIENGIPYKITDKELLERAKPLKAKKEFKKNYEEIEIPKILSLTSKEKVSPVERLQKYFIDKFGREKAQELYLRLFLTAEDYKCLKDLTEKYCKELYADLHPVKINQSVDWHLFSDGPNHFTKTPTWATSGTGYLVKK